MKGFARFRRKQEVSEMGKPDVHSPRDVTLIQSSGKLIGDLSSKSDSKKPVLLFDLNTVEGESELDDSDLPSKKRKLNEVESLPMNGCRKKSHINLEPSLPGSNTKSPSQKELNLGLSSESEPSLTLPGSNSKSPSQKELKLGLSSESERARRSTLILMICLNCYLHVMVCDDNPKCPKCKKGDSLVDMFRGSPAKKETTV